MICSIKDCANTIHAKGLCNRHYLQVRKFGRAISEGERREHCRKQKGVRLNTGRTHFRVGHSPPNKGKVGWMSEAHRQALRAAVIGNVWSRGRKRPDMAGDKNPMWRGGVRDENQKQRVRFRKFYQQKVLFRDNFTCQICEQYSGSLQVDHIKSWADYPELRFDLNNCRTLCMACHYYITFKRKLPEGIIWGHNLSRRIGK